MALIRCGSNAGGELPVKPVTLEFGVLKGVSTTYTGRVLLSRANVNESVTIDGTLTGGGALNYTIDGATDVTYSTSTNVEHIIQYLGLGITPGGYDTNVNKASVNLEATNLTQFVIDTTQSGEINQSITWVKVPKSVVGSKTKIRATDIVNGYNGIAFIKYDGEPTSVGDYTELSYGETALSNFNDYVCIGRRSGRTSRATFEFVD